MSKIIVGSTIKSLDFNGCDDCFLTGKVTSIDNEYMHCETLSVVYEGVEKQIKFSNYRVVKQGLMFNDNKNSPRITKVKVTA